MEDIRESGKLAFLIDNIDYIHLVRGEGDVFRHDGGKDKCSLIYTREGRMRYAFADGGALLAESGTLCFLPHRLPYVTEYLEDGTVVQILAFDVCGSLPERLRRPLLLHDRRAGTLFSSVDAVGRTSAAYLAARTFELLYLIEEKQTAIPERFRRLAPAVEKARTAYAENRPLSYYADLCRMSESNFRKLFKDYTGCSFIEYRNRVRLAEAHKLIAGGEATVAQAAYLAGFHNLSFFYKLYRAYRGR